MSQNDAKSSAALVVGVIALVLSVYAAISVTQMNIASSEIEEKPPVNLVEDLDENLEGQMVAVIENFIAGAYVKPIEVDEGSGLMKGDEDAPITIVEFSDYQCPFCKKFVDETFPELEEKYIETGKVKYVFRDFPLQIHAQAIPAANAARCVLEDGNMDDYWEYHDLLFTNQGALSNEDLKKYAGEIKGINVEKVATCIDENRFEADVQADFAAGQQAGVQGTPAFVINGKVLSGAQPFEAFDAAIQETLAELGEEVDEEIEAEEEEESSEEVEA